MDVTEIENLFNNPTELKKFIKKDLIRTDPSQNINENTTEIIFDCRTLTDKLIQLSDGYIILNGHFTRNDGANFAAGAAAIAASIQNGTNTLFTSCKVSLNNNEVEHNQRCDLAGTFVNMFEYSPDYAESIGILEGFTKDTITNGIVANSPAVAKRNLATSSVLDAGALDQYPVVAYIPLKNLSQFIRRLDYPIINNLLRLNLQLNRNMSILRAAGITACTFIPTEAKLMVPEVKLPIQESNKLYKAIESGSFSRTVKWDIVRPILNNNVRANSTFDILIENNVVGVRKILFMLNDHFENQEYSMFMSDIQITDFNFEIDGTQLFNTNILNDLEAYKVISECFNMQGKDNNTGCLIRFDDFAANTRIYMVDVSRQEIFESNPNKGQNIRLRGRNNGAAARLICLLFLNRTTVIDFANPNNTNTTHTA